MATADFLCFRNCFLSRQTGEVTSNRLFLLLFMMIVKNKVAFFSFYGLSTVWSQPHLLSRNTRAQKAILKLTSSITSGHLARASLKVTKGCSSCFWVAQEKYYIAAERLVWSDTLYHVLQNYPHSEHFVCLRVLSADGMARIDCFAWPFLSIKALGDFT